MAAFFHLHLLLSALSLVTAQQLSANFYDKSCPGLPSLASSVVSSAVAKEPRMAASLLRLHFHDCFVNGCDASLLLDDTSSITSEKNALPNRRSVRGFEVIDDIKSKVEQQCKGVVSCADIVSLAAREAVVLSGGPTWTVVYGRRDSTSASMDTANQDLPSFLDNATRLVTRFKAKGLSARDMVALSGGHTIGHAQCVFFRDRLYNFSGSGSSDPILQQHYVTELKQQCPSATHDRSISAFDPTTPAGFDNIYFKLLQVNKGLFRSDQVLYSTPGDTQDAVNAYSSSKAAFFKDFADAMVKMGNLSPLTGSKGQIRANCRLVNS
ncbi:hypothetical protein SELMODRAFT_126833 [Selaginella moellendorffii]|uniref:Peroxidase n=1 Tax=Selaginella moellendorffii TaxID=88036 RepID=D8SWN8_SELML|nr:peroxidase P7 [Selaginella moellendorffii]EFJ11127.1 hypothetical protein SELMODRAFT_126833 [Selaginella moellendorffii]|eukprot:XP_002987824.1 peroxidase P7 [Selaginella moellendorffii]